MSGPELLAIVCMSLGRMVLGSLVGVVLYYVARLAGAGLYYVFTWWRRLFARLADFEARALSEPLAKWPDSDCTCSTCAGLRADAEARERVTESGGPL